MKTMHFLKSIILFITFILMNFNLSAGELNYKKSNSYFEHLSTVNKEWKHHKNISPVGDVSFSSDLDRIQLHLFLAIEELKTNIPSQFNTEQKSNRLMLLSKLEEYANKKVFPINQNHSVRTPYFVDYLGTNCAVGQMIYVSGYKELVNKISGEHNYDYIKDIKTDGLTEWANEFGFTLEELKWIQPAYPPTETMDQVLNGTNGKVKKIVPNSFDTKMFIAGEFTELDNLSCLNIGVYENNQLTCLGNGIEGIINDLVPTFGGVIAVGDFEHNGEMYPVARYENSTWTYYGIPGRTNAVGVAAHSAGVDYYAYDLEIAISHSSIPGRQEVWHWLEDGTWSKRMLVNGEVNDFASSQVGRIHAGHFDTVTVYEHSGAIDTIMEVNNVIIRKNSLSTPYYRIGDDVSNEINVVLIVEGIIYFGGKCDAYDGNNIICISRYHNGTLQPVFLNEISEFEVNIKSMAFDGNTKLALGGDFNKSFSWTYGDNLATFDLINNGFMPIAVLDEPVNSVQYFEGELYVGGEFRTNFSTDSINFLGKIDPTLGLNNEVNEEVDFKVYPNPAVSEITIVWDEVKVDEIKITSYSGELVKRIDVNSSNGEKIIDISNLSSGVYFVNIGSVTKKLIVK